MKKNFFLLLALLLTGMGFSQIVNIPDANFKAKLLAAAPNNNIARNTSNDYIKIDANNDGEIQVSEALMVYKLDVHESNINDLTGYSSFLNLRDLNCSENEIPSLDCSMLTNLTTLRCFNNGMTSLNVIGANNLINLFCFNNLLTNLNVTGLVALEAIRCYNNQLTSLNLSGLSNLEIVLCQENELTNLNVTGLSSLTEFDCHDNNLSSLSVVNMTNLPSFNCSQNQLTNLTLSGLTSLMDVNASSNQLSSLNLTNCPTIDILNCSNNLFSSFNITGINSINKLYLGNNQLSSLDVSSLTNLSTLNAFNNQLTFLNVAGTNLFSLYCSNNQLTTLNVLGQGNLNTIECSNNQLSNLDLSNLPDLDHVICSNNQLTTLAISGPNYISLLDCSNNQLTSIDLSSIMFIDELYCQNNLLNQIMMQVNATSMSDFNCQNNQLTALPAVKVVELNCSYNFLTTLTIIESEVINCSHNQLTSLIIPNGPFSAFSLDCSFNLLETFTVPDNSLCYCYLNLSNNSLTSIYFNNVNIFENGGDTSYLHLDNNPNLQYICTSPLDIGIIQNKLDSYGYDNCEVNSYCSFTPGGTFYTIQGNHKFDFNSNGCDVNDLVVQHQKFTITDGTTTGNIISDETGNYNIRVQSGSHTITPVLENPNYFTITPNSLPIVFPTQTSPVNQNFCIAPNGVHPDLEVTLIPTNSASPGFDVTYKIIYKNKGTNTQSGSFSFVFDGDILDFVTSNPSTASQLPNTLTWNFSNLAPFESGQAEFTLNLNAPTETPPVNGDDVLHFSATIASVATDDMPADNTATLNQTVFNSFDPNDKTCLEGTNITPEMIGSYVHYKIRFENTGTANAQRIIVSDKIDLSKFDIATLVPIDGSHVFTTRIYDGNKVEFIFDNIQLPFDDANNDGYVVFKIKTLPTLVLGDSFSNSAAIYFDYNYPIFTNDAVTTIQVLGTPDFDFGNYFTLYPNPATNVLNIASKKDIILTSIAIYNTLGQLVITVPNAQNVSNVDVSQLASGSYFIKIASDKGSSSMQFLKK